VIYTTKLGCPALPFPTALPGSGAYIQQPVTGQHATNPEASRTWTLKTRGHNRHRQKTPRWHLIPWNTTPPPLDDYPLQCRLTQSWLTHAWKYTLTGAQRSAWATFAGSNTLTNMFAKTKLMSPFGAFLHVNRAYIYNYVIPGHPPASTAAVPWPSTPRTWAVLTPITFDNLTLIVRPGHSAYSAYGPWYFSHWVSPPLPAHAIGLMIYMSYPGKLLTSRRQGPVTLCMYIPPALYTAHPTLRPSRIYMPALQPGQLVSIAYQSVDYTSPGVSPFTWTTLTAGYSPY
jgi:hypothetical protein